VHAFPSVNNIIFLVAMPSQTALLMVDTRSPTLMMDTADVSYQAFSALVNSRCKGTRNSDSRSSAPCGVAELLMAAPVLRVLQTPAGTGTTSCTTS
jgi:hypothetical protein